MGFEERLDIEWVASEGTVLIWMVPQRKALYDSGHAVRTGAETPYA